jgi:C1A family cysteine protease
VTIDSYEDVPENNEHALKQAASQQPIAVGICASPAMQFYGGGVIDTCCDELNHGVLVVGYGTDQKTNTDFWLVKNSWGGEGARDSLQLSSFAALPVLEHAGLF